MAETKRAPETRKKRITRGPRKGQVITVYAKSGTEVKGVVSGSGTNKAKGNPRAGQDFVKSIDSKGREVHTYANGKSVTIRGRRAKEVRFAKSVKSSDGKRNVLTTRQRQNAVAPTKKKRRKGVKGKRKASK
jgi:hypothetical protein